MHGNKNVFFVSHFPNFPYLFCCRSNYAIISDFLVSSTSFSSSSLSEKVFDMYINCLSDSVVYTNDSFHVVCCFSYIRCQDDNRSFFVFFLSLSLSLSQHLVFSCIFVFFSSCCLLFFVIIVIDSIVRNDDDNGNC